MATFIWPPAGTSTWPLTRTVPALRLSEEHMSVTSENDLATSHDENRRKSYAYTHIRTTKGCLSLIGRSCTPRTALRQAEEVYAQAPSCRCLQDLANTSPGSRCRARFKTHRGAQGSVHGRQRGRRKIYRVIPSATGQVTWDWTACVVITTTGDWNWVAAYWRGARYQARSDPADQRDA